VEHRHCRSRSHLLPSGQQNLCLRDSRRSTYSNAYTDRNTNANTNANANTNSYAVTQREPYPHAESDTKVAPDSTVAPDSSAATVNLRLAAISNRTAVKGVPSLFGTSAV
jgi:hypothetical protein